MVRAKWYSLKQVSQRGYILKAEERIIPVSAIVRLLGLAFSNSYAAGRQTRSATAAGSRLHGLRKDSHNRIEAACRRQVGEEVGAENEGEGEAGEAMDHGEAE